MIKDENFITIQGWMATELGLKGNELLIYAIIYGFSQDDESFYRGSKRYLAEWTGTTTQCVLNNLKALIDKGFIVRQEEVKNGVTFPVYRALWGVKKFDGGIKIFDGGDKESLPNNIDDIDSNNIDEYTDVKRFRKPTVDEIRAYCRERNNNIDPERFFDYYESKGWKVGKAPMKDWRASVRTWERGDRQESGDGQKPMIKSTDEYEEMFERNMERSRRRTLRGGAENFND